VCRKRGGAQWLVCCDLSNVMHRDSAVEGGATKHEKGANHVHEIYISQSQWVNCDLARRYVGLNLSQQGIYKHDPPAFWRKRSMLY